MPGEAREWLVARDQRLQRLTVLLPPEAPAGAGGVQLVVADAAARPAAGLRRAWLSG